MAEKLPRIAILHWSSVQRAKALLRAGAGLSEAAEAILADPASLDLSLWRQLGMRFSP